ncbi:MAG: zf-HC2 domain-containing protein [Deltaproteobacteria bacterium]|nr:zf-HC2 domain-containing protein [Deltaproteobacteria bacterium]
MTCPDPTALAAHVDGETTANQARALERHLGVCGACHQAHADLVNTALRLRLLAAAPDPSFTADVLRRLQPERPALRPGVWALFGAVATAALVLVLQGRETSVPGELTARGASASVAQLLGVEVYRHVASDPTTRSLLHLGDRVAVGDGLSFAVINRAGIGGVVLLFGVDAAGAVHWFFPESVDRAPLGLDAGPGVVDVPEGVSLEGAAPGAFEVVAVFLDRARPELVAEITRRGVTALDGAAAAIKIQRLAVVVETHSR